MTPELLIFDFDGVLVDSEVLWNEVLAAVLTQLGHSLDPAESGRRYTGISGRDVRRAIEADIGGPLAPGFEELVKEQAYAGLAAASRMVTGADILLRNLDGPRCIASNSGLPWIDLGLRGAALDSYFPPECRFSAAQVANGKPAPDVFIHAASSMGADPAGCLVIEDSIHGVNAAVAAGMRVMGFTGASHIEDGHADVLLRGGAVAILEELPALPDLLKRL